MKPAHYLCDCRAEVVSVQWLLDSCARGERVAEQGYAHPQKEVDSGKASVTTAIKRQGFPHAVNNRFTRHTEQMKVFQMEHTLSLSGLVFTTMIWRMSMTS